jgi:hypothetical protein
LKDFAKNGAKINAANAAKEEHQKLVDEESAVL